MNEPPPTGMSRRRLLLLAANAVGVGYLGWRLLNRYCEHFMQAPVAVVDAHDYGDGLVAAIEQALSALAMPPNVVAGRRVVLKPKLVEPHTEHPHINTHPRFVLAVADVVRRRGAATVTVAEGPGHCSDTYQVLADSGLGELLRQARLPFVDLNHDDVVPVPNRMRATTLPELYLPRTICEADLVVSLPKMKTHHWAKATLSMKNLFGCMPGLVYGWPKNLLHGVGIPNSIIDVTAAVAPALAIVDGVVGMEGDGPIMGTPKAMGVVVAGTNPVAVDATCARLMGFEPHELAYLRAVSGVLGPIEERNIPQRGETVARRRNPFRRSPGTGA